MTTSYTKVTVTADDIATAKPRESDHCAIADAIRRCVPAAANVTVDLQAIRWTDRAAGERYVYLTPRTAQLFLIAFDQGDQLEPFAFQLRNPVQVFAVKAPKARAAARKRPTTTGPATVEPTGRTANGTPEIVKRGGVVPPVATLAHGRGKRREYGVRTAQR